MASAPYVTLLGIRQAAALALYRATGFHPIPLFGEYCQSPRTSVCLGKDLHDEVRK